MSGGNSHQRAIERATRAKAARETGKAQENAPSTVQQSPEPAKSQDKPCGASCWNLLSIQQLYPHYLE